ncbi:hypothetical protein ACJX0J_018907, partial [Zea mays]
LSHALNKCFRDNTQCTSNIIPYYYFDVHDDIPLASSKRPSILRVKTYLFLFIAGSCALSKVSLFDDPDEYEEEESFGQVVQMHLKIFHGLLHQPRKILPALDYMELATNKKKEEPLLRFRCFEALPF